MESVWNEIYDAMEITPRKGDTSNRPALLHSFVRRSEAAVFL